MNAVESMLLEQMEDIKFQQTVSDSFDFVDSLVDRTDLDRIFDKEDID